MRTDYPKDYKGPKAGLSDNQEWLEVTEFQAYKYMVFGTWKFSDFDCWLGTMKEWHYNKGSHDTLNIMNEKDFNDLITSVKEAGAILRNEKYQKELEKIEQILGKALGYPWFKDDEENFPRATEADGVAIGDNTAWGLAMEAAESIENYKKELKRLERTNCQLREELANPPADVQEYVLHKLGVREMIMEMEAEIRNLKDKLKDEPTRTP